MKCLTVIKFGCNCHVEVSLCLLHLIGSQICGSLTISGTRMNSRWQSWFINSRGSNFFPTNTIINLSATDNPAASSPGLVRQTSVTRNYLLRKYYNTYLLPRIWFNWFYFYVQVWNMIVGIRAYKVYTYIGFRGRPFL